MTPCGIWESWGHKMWDMGDWGKNCGISEIREWDMGGLG